MPEPHRARGGRFKNVHRDEYLSRRGLRRYARALHLWALGVGAVISGDFFGWNFGLEYGFWSLFAANVIITIMFFGLAFGIAARRRRSRRSRT